MAGFKRKCGFLKVSPARSDLAPVIRHFRQIFATLALANISPFLCQKQTPNLPKFVLNFWTRYVTNRAADRSFVDSACMRAPV